MHWLLKQKIQTTAQSISIGLAQMIVCDDIVVQAIYIFKAHHRKTVVLNGGRFLSKGVRC
jgi:hypothetical protein